MTFRTLTKQDPDVIMVCPHKGEKDMPSLVIGLLWALLGLVLGVPYFYAASVPEHFFGHCFILVPILTVFGAFLYLFEFARTHSKKPSLPFSIYVLWALSPILLNLIAFVTKTWISEAVGSFVFKYRFVPLWAPVVLVFIMIALAPIFTSNKNELKQEPPTTNEQQ